MNITEIRFHGPLSLVENPEVPEWMRSPHAWKGGIYLWTIPLNDGYLINYVGQSGCFEQEHPNNVEYELTCRGACVDPDGFILGKRNIILPHPEMTVRREWARRIVTAYRGFIAPFDGYKPDRERIEYAVLRHLLHGERRYSSFLANKKYHKPHHSPVPLKILCDSTLLGLPHTLEA